MSELAHSRIQAGEHTPERWMIFVHGILGTRANWRGLARRFVRRRPKWGAILVDLRQHGDSQGFAGPHHVAAAAADLDLLDASFESPIEGILGHSFGGKVALAYAADHHGDLDSVVLVDSLPGARRTARGSEGTLRVVSMLRELSRDWSSREDFVEAVVGEGHEEPLARWLAMNLQVIAGAGDRYRLRLDLDAIGELLADYFAVDLWSVVEAMPRGMHVEMVVGGASTIFDGEALDRAAAVAARVPAMNLEVIEGAGHWVHVDAPGPLLAVWERSLS